MKTIAIITDRQSQLVEFLEQNLKMVLGTKIIMNKYFLDNLNEYDVIDDDVVLVMISERAYEVKKHVSKKSKIVVLNRTFQQKDIHKILSIPESTQILVVNDNDQTTYESLSLFYEIGINHLDFIAFNEGIDYSHIKIAVTPGVKERVPDYIDTIIDLGNRYIDISTFIQIISSLGIDNIEISKKLVKYSEKIVSLDVGIRDKYKELFLKIEELDTILNLSKDGIIFTNNKGKINVLNESFRKIMDINSEIKDKNISDIITEELELITEKEEIIDEVFQFKDKYININKTGIAGLGYYYNVQEITYIKQLEQNLTKQIKTKGQIARYYFQDIKTQCESMKKCIDIAKKMSKSDLTVLIIGESGTGKELLAQSIHNESKRTKQPFVAVNCAAMPENLLESELFGYEKGAFTGALKEGKKGLFELANNGTIFLDEIGDMPLLLQTKLLRVLQERQVMPIGSEKIIDINVRVIAATNKDILSMIHKGEFREDLYYRLNVLPLRVPPLRNREGDIMELLKEFMKKDVKFSIDAVKKLLNYNWPGNIRELQNVASYISLMCNDIATYEDLPFNVEEEQINEYDECVYILKSKCNFERCVDIVKIINKFNSINESVGRNAIFDILTDRGIETSEGEIKKILSLLKELGFIDSTVGRKGSKLTELGKNIITN